MPTTPSSTVRFGLALLSALAAVVSLATAAPAAADPPSPMYYYPVVDPVFVSGFQHPHVGVPIRIADPIFDREPGENGRIANTWSVSGRGPFGTPMVVKRDTCTEVTPPDSPNPGYCLKWDRALYYIPTLEDVGHEVSVYIQASPPEGDAYGYSATLRTGEVDATADNIITDARVETQNRGADTWNQVDADHPVIAGNPTRLRYDLSNQTDAPVTVGVRILDRHGNPVEGSSQTVTLDPDSLQTYTVPVDSWSWAYDAGAPTPTVSFQVLARPTADEEHHRDIVADVAPRPVVLAHGYNSDASTWNGFTALLRHSDPRLTAYAVGDGRFDGREDTGDLSQPSRGSNSIHENAEQVAHYIDGVRGQTGAEHVDVVAHSMGGLISRDYIQTLMPASADAHPLIGHLIQLGTPNIGSPCADGMMLASMILRQPQLFPQPATSQLTTWSAAEFDRQITDLRGVALSNLVGQGIPLPCDLQHENSDGVVPVWSARWTIPAQNLQTATIPHTSMTSDQSIVDAYVFPRLADTPGVGSSASRSAVPADTTEGPGSSSVFATQTANLQPGESTELPFTAPTASAITITAYRPGFDLTLIAPDGTVTDHAEPAGDGPGGMQNLSVHADQPAAGHWTLRVHAAGPYAVVGAPIVFAADGDSLVTTVVRAEHTPSRSNVVVRITDGGRPVTGATVRTSLQLGSQSAGADLMFSDDGTGADATAGDGEYSASGTLTGLDGTPIGSIDVRLPDGRERWTGTALTQVAKLTLPTHPDQPKRATPTITATCSPANATSATCVVTVAAKSTAPPTGAVRLTFTDATDRPRTVTWTLDATGHATGRLPRMGGHPTLVTVRYSGDARVRNGSIAVVATPR